MTSRQISSHGAGQLTSEVVSVDDHLSLGQLSATQLSNVSADTTHLSQLPSLRADGTATLLLAESFNNHQIQCNTSPLEEAIIEMDTPTFIQTPPKSKSSR